MYKNVVYIKDRHCSLIPCSPKGIASVIVFMVFYGLIELNNAPELKSKVQRILFKFFNS